MPDTNPSLEVIAPTVEEAIAKGSRELGVPKEKLNIQILDEGNKGLLGMGSRQARVRLTLAPEAEELQAARQEQPSAATEERPTPQETPVSEEDLTEDELTLQLAREAVEDLLEHMDIQASLNAHWGEPDSPGKLKPLFVDIEGDDLSMLIGRGGETLDALQYISRLILGKELKKPVPVIIDVEGYRARREKTLRRLARRMAEQALERGRTLSLEPMPPNERRIIHIELREHPQVRTQSVGDGDRRKVTIIPER
ncbi:MAG: RNA-binding cell elongation regulator Jag/EloR [Anaerolineales bacterium]